MLQFFQPLEDGSGVTRLFRSRSGPISGLRSFGPRGGRLSGWFLQARDLFFDHWNHLDAEVTALEQSFERGDRSRVATSAERKDRGHANREMWLTQIAGDLFCDFLVAFLKARQAANRGRARVDLLPRSGPLLEQRNRLVIAQRAKSTKRGVTHVAVGRIARNSSFENAERAGGPQAAKGL